MPNPISKFSGFLLSDKSFGIFESLIVKPNLRLLEISSFNFSISLKIKLNPCPAKG